MNILVGILGMLSGIALGLVILLHKQVRDLTKQAKAFNELLNLKPKTFLCYIKSHCESADYEQEVLAYTKQQAIQKFLESPSLREYSAKDIEDFVGEI